MKKWIYMMAAAAAMAACSNEELPGNDVNNTDEAQQVTVIATLPGADSRVTLQDVTENGKNIIKVDWNESGEKFTAMTTAFVVEENEQTYVFTQTEGEEFGGTLPAAVSGEPYYAFYPAVDIWTENSGHPDGGSYNYWDAETGEGITAFSATQVPFDLTRQNGKLDESKTLMYATSEDGTKFDFHHLTAIVKFTLTGLPASMTDVWFRISWENEVSHRGVFDLTQTDVKAMYPTAAEGGGIVVSTTANNGSSTFYAYLPPLAQGTDLSIRCSFEDENYKYVYTKEVELQKAVEAGKFYRLERSMTTEQQSRHMTACDVEGLKAWIDASQKFGNGISLTLTADIDLTNVDLDEDDTESNWPELNLYDATFDGDGYTLTGLKRHTTTAPAAMFRSIYPEATVKNLHLVDVDFKSSSYFAAGIVAENSGTVEGCSVSGTVVSEATRYSVAGVVSFNQSTGIVKGCYSIAPVKGTGVGGVVGQNEGTVTACYSTGTLEGEYVGGVAYSSRGSVSSCYWDCTGANYGIYFYNNSSDSTNEGAAKVDGTTVTWESAMNAMNTALGSGFGWQYVKNNDEATNENEPLKLEKNN